MASLSDILATAQNIAQAINGVASGYVNVQGSTNSANISTATLVKPGAGRIANISIMTAGSTAGAIYDTNSATGTLNKIYTIPNSLGVFFINFPLSFGLVVAPGTGQVVSVSYS